MGISTTSERETALILAGLRLLQAMIRSPSFGSWAEPWLGEDAEPVTPEELDELCEAINTGETP